MKKILFFAAIFLLLLLALFLLSQTPAQPQKYALVNTPTSQITAKIADTDSSRALGLMHEHSLCSACGMLFVFPDSQVRYFWMKNTLIPLDMVFIYENFTVEGIRTAYPCGHDPCPLQPSAHAVKYVLEINANSSGALGIREGTRLIATNLSSVGQIPP
ncbi:putative ACR [Candidatus Anstonella stagnisolia]|nr:putative ACR [Candidatus Anstonella stagnisolia]